MADTYSQLYIQIVFAVKGRQNLISKKWKDEIYKYITGIITNQKQKLIAINGMPDHIHILVGIKPNISLSDLVRDIKSSSSKFINEQKWINGKFEWQNGFGAFSYGHSQLTNVIKYIENQEEHHKTKTFKEEYIAFLKLFNIDFKDEYIFKEF
ncbi:IS200/IS605 family transposase [Flavobacterium johnsoniae]|uniref:Transposase IS200-family protein n=1 Tax=Flavobacterium johnsoniae (strain ATCC 17061 / DSM 2064 / JCM 8514 / BCRC 14874 / CCUG 350202 / NBRC 14942 / NCIMB 11054 / UW101) TaxID=376686 RepID=A5FLD5_FLAJ1|nr:IS200/IS605 family transposase [Flavobacterium johnsoniae]ABQ03985.1 transposase IS200-family protein [Flavobacterium johnsoniae UW101]OXE96143.1 transposase [Flavobacterium johnsoniae UW101]WQG79146.1 IS200/IS605 family transposase [Flavobacterium johnsoniae UW101]SHK08853.1 REP element-mobilizing transposase RayT [Flavobacterium johnsoniae]